MSKTISEIYTEYKIMPLLQEHMLRVAGVASMICDNINESLPKEEIITACLLHDMGNIIKSNFEFLPESLEPHGRAYWQKVKDDYIKKYGPNDHHANVQILKELNLSASIIDMVDKIQFSCLCKHRDENDMSMKIVAYADSRVSPYGIVSYEERMDEAETRYKLKNILEERERTRLIECGKDTERQIFAKCIIKPEDINDTTAAPIISKLRDFVIK